MINKRAFSPISVYIPNLTKRTDRKASIEKQFKNKNEFELNIVQAIEHKIGAFGLWQTFMNIVRNEYNKKAIFLYFVRTTMFSQKIIIKNISLKE